jgi:hypothetical protein
MRWGIVALALALGLAGGYAVSAVVDDHPAAAGRAVPVVAASPSVPVDPPPELVADPDVPPLERDVETRPRKVGARNFAVTVPAPVGWTRSNSLGNESMWLRPGNPSFTYVLRVEVTTAEHRTLEAMVDRRIEDLFADEEDVRILDKGPDSLEFTYVQGKHLRHAFLTWLDLSGSGDAELEVALTGRAVDEPGMRDLLATIVAGARA